jgi:hypothetical protein
MEYLLWNNLFGIDIDIESLIEYTIDIEKVLEEILDD